MRIYERDDLRGIWRCREAMSVGWTPCDDDPIVRYLDAVVLPLLRREIMARYRGGFIRDIRFTAMTDPWNRLNPLVEGFAMVTPIRGSRYMWARIEVSAMIGKDGTVSHRGVTRAKDPMGLRPMRVKTYIRPMCDVTDDMSR